nr:cytochrome oxidase subunit 2, mitochondrial [Tanacetum cinerariifolium]
HSSFDDLERLGYGFDLNYFLSCLVDYLWAGELTISNFSPADSPTFSKVKYMHATCPLMYEWFSHSDHRSLDEMIETGTLCLETTPSIVNPAITIKAIGHQWYRSAPLHEGDLSAMKCLKNMVHEASGLPHRSLWFHLVVAGAVAYNFGPNGRPSNLSEWGIPVGNNHGSSCGTTGPGEDNLLFLLLFLRFGDGGPTVGVKCDVVPGRLNQISILVQQEGVYYGQCSEIYGTNHAFMRAPRKIGRLLSPLWLSRTTLGASHPRSKLLQQAAEAVWSRRARQ